MYVSADVGSSDDEDAKGDKRRPSPGVMMSDDEEELPVYLWRPGQTTDVIGKWEQHTRVSSAAVSLAWCSLADASGGCFRA